MIPSDLPKLKFGLLPPNSNFVPRLAGDMLTAIELGLAETRLDAEIVVESAGYNADLKMLVPAIQRLILAGRVDCIIVPLNVSVIESIAEHCRSQAVPLIALNLTEDPLFETSRNPFIFVNSFHLWRSAWMSGYLAAKHFGGRGATMAPIHEGGYGLAFAFQLGLEAAQGGLVQAVVTHRNSNTEDPSASISEIAAQNPDFIWAAYSGKEAISFLDAFRASGLRDKIPLMTIPTMVSQNVRQSAGESIDKIWYVTQKNPETDDSANSLADALGREPNPYALLAYEAIHLIAAAVRNAGETKNLAEALPEFLGQSEFQSRDGSVRFNSGSISNTFYLRQINGAEDTVEKVEAPPLLDEQYQLACKKLVKQGWINPYLCA